MSIDPRYFERCLASSVVVVGLGNIGGQVASLLGGVPGVQRVLLIDPDSYEPSNLGHQRLAQDDVGRLKVDVQERELRAFAPHIHTEAHACRVEAMPTGKLRGAVMLSCVDSRMARQSINRIASRLGLIWIDAALDSAGSVRARIYAPGGDCLECNWSEPDYELLEQRLPCNVGAAVAPTAAPMELGAIAAGLQIALLRRLAFGQPPSVGELARQQWFYDLPSGRGWVGRYGERNPSCRFDHACWTPEALARPAHDLTIGEVFALAGADNKVALSVEGQMFVRRVRCVDCRAVAEVGARLDGRLDAAACPQCGRAMSPAVMDASEFLSSTDLCADLLARPLADFGLVDGDIVTLQGPERAPLHLEVGSPNAEAF